jgi:hypothetical protein
MKTEFRCEVCGGTSGEPLRSRSYSAESVSRGDEYDRKRFRVLFEVWCAGASEVTFTAVMCKDCGFVCDLPRAEPDDVHSKYAALTSWGQDYGESDTDAIVERRSRNIFAAVQSAIPLKPPMRILDFGGGDGRLMRTFRAAGHHTFLVDYNISPVEWIQKLGDTLDNLTPTTRFDLIVANHVLEHVAEPTDVVRRLSRHLYEDGHLFLEVPMEIWRAAPAPLEPVTHVNYFVPGSLRRCLEEAGFDVVFCRLAQCVCAPGIHVAVQALAKPPAKVVAPRASGVHEVAAFLAPSVRQKIRRRILVSGGIGPMLRDAIWSHHAS